MTKVEHPGSGRPDNREPHEHAYPFEQDGISPREAGELSAAHQAPPVGEEIHMPDPTLIPILNAVSVTMMLLGVTTIRAVLWAGLVLFVITTAIWIRDSRREFASLPAEHGHEPGHH